MLPLDATVLDSHCVLNHILFQYVLLHAVRIQLFRHTTLPQNCALNFHPAADKSTAVLCAKKECDVECSG